MRYITIIVCLAGIIALSSCSKSPKENNSTTTGNKTAPTTTETRPASDNKKENSEKPLNKGVETVKAKFTDFSFGDTEHYIFTDDSGKEYDFGGNESDKDFAVELSKEETNDTNQGWAVNDKLKGKWFNIKYEVRKQAQYEGGPVADVAVILEAALAN
jgi:hypothetical protein